MGDAADFEEHMDSYMDGVEDFYDYDTPRPPRRSCCAVCGKLDYQLFYLVVKGEAGKPSHPIDISYRKLCDDCAKKKRQLVGTELVFRYTVTDVSKINYGPDRLAAITEKRANRA